MEACQTLADAPPLEDGLGVVRHGALVKRRRTRGGGGEVERQLLLHAVERVERVHAAAGPSSSVHDGPALRTRSKTKGTDLAQA